MWCQSGKYYSALLRTSHITASAATPTPTPAPPPFISSPKTPSMCQKIGAICTPSFWTHFWEAELTFHPHISYTYKTRWERWNVERSPLSLKPSWASLERVGGARMMESGFCQKEGKRRGEAGGERDQSYSPWDIVRIGGGRG